MGSLLRVLDELLWTLRRDGFEISTAQAIDAVRAVAAVGLDRRDHVRHAVAAVVVQRAGDRARYDAAFDRFFAPDTLAARSRTLWDRLAARGFDETELRALRALLALLADGRPNDAEWPSFFLERGADLDDALARSGLARQIDAYSEVQLGFLTHRVLSRVGAASAGRALAWLRPRLVEALGTRGQALADALAEEIERSKDDVGSSVRRAQETALAALAQQTSEHRLATTPFTALSEAEIEEVRRSVRQLAEKLRAGRRVRARRRVRGGRLDARRTLRRGMRTGGVPVELVRTRRSLDRPKLVVLCDVSESVRAVASFLLELTHAVHELFERTRSFVFVSDIEETTDLFVHEKARNAVERAARGGAVRAGSNSNYGRVLRSFESLHAGDIDRRTTVVILGDGRSNYHAAAADALGRLRDRSRALLWLCPEPRSKWGQGDSAMAAYAPKCTAVLEVRCAADLERAARALVSA